jgi:hypothetical protein
MYAHALILNESEHSAYHSPGIDTSSHDRVRLRDEHNGSSNVTYDKL